MQDVSPMPGLCIVAVPCYNEEHRLDVAAFRNFLESRPQNLRLLFVNDGSRDSTLRVLNSLQAEFSDGVGVLDQPRNMGKAEAVRCGMLEAIRQGATSTGFWDADLATPLSELIRLRRVLGDAPAVEILLGSRVRLLGRWVTRKATRHYSGRIFATIASLVLSLPVYDTQCGAKLFRVSARLEQILTQPFGSRWIFDVELLARFLTLRERAAEAPTVNDLIREEPLLIWNDVGGSKLKLTDSFKAIGELMAIRRRYF